jgi:hypothetical protein
VGHLIPWEFPIDDRVDQNTVQSGLHNILLKRKENYNVA